MAKSPEFFKAKASTEAPMPKNPLMSDPAMQAMQKALVGGGVKKQKPMNIPKKRVRAQADFAKKAF